MSLEISTICRNKSAKITVKQKRSNEAGSENKRAGLCYHAFVYIYAKKTGKNRDRLGEGEKNCMTSGRL